MPGSKRSRQTRLGLANTPGFHNNISEKADEAGGALGDALTIEVTKIYEACSFQDITGQRIKKVVDTLTHIEQRLERFASVMGVEDAELEETLEDKRKRENLLNGPALNGPEVAQDDIDALFGTEGASMDQSDLDALFD